MKRLSFFMAQRYTSGIPEEKTLTTMTRICFWSIFLGSFSLALVMAIMNGFERATHEKIQGINADSTMRTFHGEFDTTSLEEALSDPSLGIQAWSPTAMGHALITSNNELDLDGLVILKGIDAHREEKVTTLATMVHKTLRNTPFSALVTGNNVLIGSTLARTRNLHINDSITLYVADQSHSSSTKLALSKKTAVVAGVFQTGIDDFDATIIICSLPFLQEIDPNARIDTINLKHRTTLPEKTIITALRERFDDVDVYSWKDLYPALVDALRLEKYAMFLVLALIMLVACTNIIALLFMQIIQKRGEIAVLRSLGMKTSSIRAIFIIMGMRLTFIATALGITFATILSFIIDTYKIIPLPDVYYVTHVPSRMELSLILLVAGLTLCISFFATWFSTRKIATLPISHILRFDT